MPNFMELHIEIVTNFDSTSRNALHPGRTHTSLGPTWAGTVDECVALSLLKRSLGSLKRNSSHAHKTPLRSNTMVNHLGADRLAGARGMSTIALELAAAASTTWIADGKEKGRNALPNMFLLIQGLHLI